MHILLISQCEKKAIKRTNEVLDSYALRVGSRAWASPITLEGLQELHSALRNKATRQTAVACYQNDGRHSMKLLWIVGSRKAFNKDGIVPVKIRQENKIKDIFTPTWLRYACLLAKLAGYVHDIGKNSLYFQSKLRNASFAADSARHELISLGLFRGIIEGNSLA